MARMFPIRIPFHVAADPFRSTEIDVFNSLASQLSDDYTVFYSRPWLGLTPLGVEVDGEADFVVTHATFGLLTIEVKGGRISYDAATDAWKSKDRHGFTSTIKDPVSQARTCKHRLLEKFIADKNVRFPHIRARHGVVFPHTAKPKYDLGPDRPLNIFCFTEQYPELGRWVMDRMGTREPLAGKEQPLSEKGMARCVDVLARSFELRVPASTSLRAGEREIEMLSTEQCSVLDFIAYHRRCGIAGPAGTGKTVLAIEKAIRCAEIGMKTIVLCFNRPLANHLKSMLHPKSSIQVYTFHEFVLVKAKWANVHHNLSVTSGAEEWAHVLLAATEVSSEPLEALIVDEGQDFDQAWWDVLDLMLGKESLLYVFYDSQQQFYSMPTNFLRLIPHSQFPLTYNLRNTKDIFTAAKPWFGSVVVTPKGPTGDPVTWTALKKGADIASEVGRLVVTLVRDEGISPSQIAILTSREPEAEALRASAHLRAYSPSAAGVLHHEGLTVSGIRRFKGLDSAVVILVFQEPHAPEPELLYVGLTRARTLLYVLADRAMLDWFKEKTFLAQQQ